MSRKTHVYVLAIATAFCVSAVGCSGSNDPATPAGAGAPSSGAGAPGAGASNVAGAPGGAGAPTGGAGAPTGGAGAPATGGDGAGGAPAAAGAAGTAGASTGGGTGGTFTPLCTTATKAAPCTATDQQLCYKTCGPLGSGFKSETCTAGVYVEQSGCSFPPEPDYACFKIPTTQDATCPTTTITASSPCTTNMCTVCSDATGHYYDSQNNLKVGYCVCPAPNAAGTAKWSCASNTAWPCPTGKGC